MAPAHPSRDSQSYRARVRKPRASVAFAFAFAFVVGRGSARADELDSPPEEASETVPAPADPAPEIVREDPVELAPAEVAERVVGDEGDDGEGEDLVVVGEEEDEEEPEKRVKISGFPFAFYLPETSVGFGFGIGVSTLTARPREGSRDRWFPTNITIGGAYTVRRQFRLLLTPELYLRRGRLVIDGLSEFRIYPDRFYGLGRGTDEQFQRYTDFSFRTSTSFRYQAARGIYVGAVVDAAWTDIRDVAQTDSAGFDIPDVPSSGWLGTGAVPGETGSRVLGAGPTFVLDRRDFPLMSRSGSYVRIVAVGVPKMGPFRHRFLRTVLEVRTFVPFFDGKLVLGGHWFFAGVIGDAPFNHLASVGGPLGLRSYPDGRFRDSVQSFAQLELRFPIVWRIRGAFHVGTGAVAGRYSGDRRFDPLWAVGIGLRAVIFEDRRIAVRGDLVLGPEGLRVLAFVHEAF